MAPGGSPAPGGGPPPLLCSLPFPRMVLTGPEIIRQIELGAIHIAPFVPAHVGPNSYDVTLNEKLLVYDLAPGEALDMKRDNPVRALAIPPGGLVLEPGILYIGCTNETAT